MDNLIERIQSVNMKDTMGRWRTLSLFWEYRKDGHEAIFNLKHNSTVKDGVEYLSLKELYLMFDDPTEYEFANTVLGGWRHWQLIKNSNQINARVDFADWAEEMELKLASRALQAMIRTATSEDGKGTTAAKYLVERQWKKLLKSSAGRPSNKEDIISSIDSEIEEDMKRLEVVK